MTAIEIVKICIQVDNERSLQHFSKQYMVAESSKRLSCNPTA